jgi:hypothetical protein
MGECGNNAKTAFYISNPYVVSFLWQKGEWWKECGRGCYDIIITAVGMIVALSLENAG